MGFNVCNVDRYRNACNDDCSSCPVFGVFSSTVEFVDYLDSVRFSEETITKKSGNLPIHVDGNGNIRIEECGVYIIGFRILVGSRSSWALFRVDNGNDVIIPSSFVTNQISEDILMRQPYSQDSDDFISFTIPVTITGATTIKLKNITGNETGQAGVDRTGAVRVGDGFMVKILSKDNVVSGIPFPGIVLEVHKLF